MEMGFDLVMSILLFLFKSRYEVIKIQLRVIRINVTHKFVYSNAKTWALARFKSIPLKYNISADFSVGSVSCFNTD